ncbi:MAG: TetR/AcrR family transcriptional regulator [Bacilli bacterium]|nr:TetR/AcrR family transcriptional regulator [Bacilli bacterium]
MKTEHALAKALKEMMATRSLDDISVMEISKKCGVSRKTFYYHYHDIYDLLTQVFLDEKIPNLNNATNFEELVEIVFAYYKKNEAFINATIDSAGKDLFSEFIYNAFYTTIIRFITKVDANKVFPIARRRSIARFYAYGYSESTVYYLANHKNKTLEGLLGSFTFIKYQNFVRSLQNDIKEYEK